MIAEMHREICHTLHNMHLAARMPRAFLNHSKIICFIPGKEKNAIYDSIFEYMSFFDTFYCFFFLSIPFSNDISSFLRFSFLYFSISIIITSKNEM